MSERIQKPGSTSVIDHMTMSAPSRGKVGGAEQPASPGERSPTMIIIAVDYHPEFQQLHEVALDVDGQETSPADKLGSRTRITLVCTNPFAHRTLARARNGKRKGGSGATIGGCP